MIAAIVLVVSVWLTWILIFQPEWATNHWLHWLRGDF